MKDEGAAEGWPQDFTWTPLTTFSHGMKTLICRGEGNKQRALKYTWENPLQLGERKKTPCHWGRGRNRRDDGPVTMSGEEQKYGNDRILEKLLC